MTQTVWFKIWNYLCGGKDMNKKEIKLPLFYFLSIFFNQGRGENKYQVQNQQKREIHTYVKKEAALI